MYCKKRSVQFPVDERHCERHCQLSVSDSLSLTRYEIVFRKNGQCVKAKRDSIFRALRGSPGDFSVGHISQLTWTIIAEHIEGLRQRLSSTGSKSSRSCFPDMQIIGSRPNRGCAWYTFSTTGPCSQAMIGSSRSVLPVSVRWAPWA